MDEYQRKALITAGSHLDKNTALTNWALGIAGEAGEFADYIKKVVFHQHDLDITKAKDELGDILWYIAVTASELGLLLSEVSEFNVDKLKKRYPEGFSFERSKNREEYKD